VSQGDQSLTADPERKWGITVSELNDVTSTINEHYFVRSTYEVAPGEKRSRIRLSSGLVNVQCHQVGQVPRHRHLAAGICRGFLYFNVTYKPLINPLYENHSFKLDTKDLHYGLPSIKSLPKLPAKPLWQANKVQASIELRAYKYIQEAHALIVTAATSSSWSTSHPLPSSRFIVNSLPRLS
jgi:hypothetical protein